MSDFFLGEIRLFAFNRIPNGWMACQGQSMQISQNTALFSLIGTAYGGDGRTTFNLPDLRGVAPLCIGPQYPLGAAGGEAFHALTANEIPMHTHQATGSTKGATVASPEGNTWASLAKAYAPAASANATMAAEALSIAGASQPHSNMQPYIALSLCISIQGIFPSRP